MILSHPQTKQIRLANDEIKVLVEDLGDVLGGPGVGGLGGEVFEQGAGYRGEEVDVGGGVEAAG